MGRVTDLYGPRAYRVQLHHGDSRAPVDPCVVVLDFSPGEPAYAARDELDQLGEQLATSAVISRSELRLCWLQLSDPETSELVTTWWLGRRR